MRHILSLLVFMPLIAFASTSPHKRDHYWWINLGAGMGTVFDDDVLLKDESAGAAFEGSINFTTTHDQLVTLRATGVNGNEDFGSDIGLMYGYMYKNEMFLASVSVGLAYTQLNLGDHSDQEGTHAVLGFPLETQIFWTPTSERTLGIGLIGIANVNHVTSFGAALFGLQVGGIR